MTKLTKTQAALYELVAEILERAEPLATRPASQPIEAATSNPILMLDLPTFHGELALWIDFLEA